LLDPKYQQHQLLKYKTVANEIGEKKVVQDPVNIFSSENEQIFIVFKGHGCY